MTVVMAVSMVSVLSVSDDSVAIEGVTEDFASQNYPWFSEGMVEGNYVIENEVELYQVGLLVAGGHSFSGETVTLEDDIVFDTYTNWTPIGTETHPFSGTFDGAGHTISNLVIDNQTETYTGLFGFVKGETPNTQYTTTSQLYNNGSFNESVIAETNYSAVLKDLTLTYIDIKAIYEQVGALVGHASNTYISGITVESGTISAPESAGGIAGRMYGSAMVGCSTGEDLSITDGGWEQGDDVYNFGGLVGATRNSEDTTSIYLNAIVESENSASISTYLTAGGIGGIVGHVGGNMPLVVYDCKNYGPLTVTGNNQITAVYQAVVGGIGGLAHGSNDNVIALCDNYGTITSTSTGTPGCLSGIANYFSGTLYECNNYGEISGNAYYVAGMVAHGGNITVDGCINHGAVENGYDDGYASTLVAGNSPTTYTNMTFQDVQELNDALPKAGKTANGLTNNGVTLTLENVIVLDNSGTLNLPEFLNSIVSDTRICSTVEIGNRNVYVSSPYQNNTQVEIGIPDVDVNFDGTVAEPGYIALNADGMTLNISVTSSVPIIRLHGGDGITIVNDGKIGLITDDYLNNGETTSDNTKRHQLSGSVSVTIYNGSESNNGSTLDRITANYVNATVYNYGTMSCDGYILSVGFASTGGTEQSNVFNFHNYGNFIGNRAVDAGQNYLMYIPAAASFNFYNYEGSRMINNSNPVGEALGTWYIYYGDDGDSTTKSEGGTFTFYYAPNTVLRPDSAGASTFTSIVPNDSIRVGADNGTTKYIELDTTGTTTYTVTINDGLGNIYNIIVEGNGTVPLPKLTATGLMFEKWTTEDGADWDEAKTVTANVTIYAHWKIEKPDVTIVGPEFATAGTDVTFDSFVKNASPYLDYIYSWTYGGRSADGSSITFALDADTTVSLSVTASAKDSNQYIGVDVTSDEESASCTVVTGNTVTFEFIGVDWDPISVVIPVGEILQESDVPLEDHPGFEVNHFYGNLNSWIGDRVTADMTVEVQLKLLDPLVTITVEEGFGPAEVTIDVVDSYDGDVGLIIGYVYDGQPVVMDGNTVVLSESGFYTFIVEVLYDGAGVESGSFSQELYVDATSIPFIPDDDDDYVPIPIPQPTQDESDSDVTTIVACAAAAVVAALIAAFLIIDRKH